MTSQLKDTNAVQRSIAHNSVHSLQKRCLQILSPPVTKHEPPSSRSAITRTEKSEPKTIVEDKEKSKAAITGVVSKPDTDSARLGKPPSRRIQRPTSIRRPKLIGKSVDGAAVQAMAASRARASATRGSSPFQKASKAAKSKEVIAVDRKAEKNLASPATKTGLQEDGQHPAELNQDQNALAAELSLLVKNYIATMPLRAASPFHHSRIVQALIDRTWLMNPERPLGPAAREFLLTRSLHLWSSACEPFGYPDRMMKDISGYFAQWLKMSSAEFNLLQLDAPSHHPSELSPSSTLIVELKRIHNRKLCVVLKTSLKFKSGNKNPVLRCDAWMVLLSRVGEGARPRTQRHTRKSVHRFEREATLIDKKVCTFAVS